MGEVFLIQYFDAGPQSFKMLCKLVDEIESRNKKFIITSHSTVSSDILKRSCGYFYDPVNPLYEVESNLLFFRTLGDQILYSPYLYYGSISHRSHAIAAFTNFLNGICLAKQLGFDIVHCIEYDCIPDFQDLDENKKLIESGKCNGVVYKEGKSTIQGAVFTLRINSSINTSLSFSQIKSHFSEFNDFSEVAFYEQMKNWLGSQKFIEKNKKIQPALFMNELGSLELETVLVEEETSGNILIYIIAGSNRDTYDVKCYSNCFSLKESIRKEFWRSCIIGNKEDTTFVDVYLENKLYKSWDISSAENYAKFVSRNFLKNLF